VAIQDEKVYRRQSQSNSLTYNQCADILMRLDSKTTVPEWMIHP
jgi:hypothetical protein